MMNKALGSFVLLASLLAAACSQLPSLTDAGVTTTGSTTPGATLGVNLSPEEVASSGPAVPLNPFADLSSQPTGGREVIANPTLAEILEPSLLPEIAFGQADAPVTIVQYASLTCPYCQRFHEAVYPALKREYIDTGKVRYILRDFPIGRTSGQASVALRCAKPEKFLELYGRFLAEQAAWVSQDIRFEAIEAVAAKSGLSSTAYAACRQDAQLVEAIKAMKDRGRKLGIIGTPNFFIQDKRIKKTLEMDELRAMIDPLLTARTAATTPNL
jgi:protein-disulfide isomerase